MIVLCLYQTQIVFVEKQISEHIQIIQIFKLKHAFQNWASMH